MKGIKIGMGILISVMVVSLVLIISGFLPIPAASSNLGKKVIIIYKNEVTDQDVDELEQMGGQIKYVYDIIPGIAATIEEQALDDLEMDEDVDYIVPEQIFHVMLSDSTKIIGADQVWAKGIDGTGTRVCMIDTGIDSSHPALLTPVAWKDFVNGKPNPYDDHGHGTHTSGIVASQNSTYKGVAPGSSLMVAKVCNSTGSCATSDIIAAIEWCSKGPDGSYGTGDEADVISMSLGGGAYKGKCDSEPTAQASNNAVDKGVVVVAASGNDGYLNAISAPACGSKVIAVGAVDKSDGRTTFSNEGSELDLVAPGVSIVSTQAGGGFVQMTGTSMSTPHVSATCALLLQTDSSLTPAQVRTKLRDTAKDLGNPGFDTIYGYGRVDAYAAYQAVAAPPTSATLTVVDGYDQKMAKTLKQEGKTYVVQTSDNQRWETEFGYYTSYEFKDISLPAGATISSVVIYVEHYEEEKFTKGKLEWKIGTGWPNNPVVWAQTNPPVREGEWNETTDSWDVSSFVNTPEKLNSMELQIKNNDNVAERKTLVDHIYAEVSWTTNQPPVANPQSVTTSEDTSIVIILSGSDPDGDSITFNQPTNPSHGKLDLDPSFSTNGKLTYAPDLNFNGQDSFTFTVNDGKVDSASATVSITVTAVNDPPVANPQSVTTKVNKPVSITLTGSDVDGDPLTFSIVQGPTHGSLSGDPPNVTYTPKPGFTGSDSFTFKVYDGKVYSNPAEVKITINPNRPPVADPQSVTTAEDTSVNITLTGSDPDGDPLTYHIVANPPHGNLSGTPPNVTYTPDANYNGQDGFTFKVYDGELYSDPAKVSITVTAINDPPVADNQSVTLDEDTSKNITLTASDVDGDPLTYHIVANPSYGSLSGIAPNLTYKPDPNYNGPDSFTFKANDGKVDSNIATVSITVNPVNDPPTITSIPVTTATVDTLYTYDVEATDPDGDILTYSLIAKPIGMNINKTTGLIEWTPTNDQVGNNDVKVKVEDNKQASATQSFTINVKKAAIEITREIFFKASPDTEMRGTKFKITVWVENKQDKTATGVKIKEKFDSGFFSQGDPSTGHYSKGNQYLDASKNMVWEVGDLTSGEIAFMTYWLYLPTNAGQYSVKADLTYSGNTYSDYSTSTVNVTSDSGEFDFSWHGIKYPQEVRPGETYSLELAISNLGRNDITSGNVKLSVPEGWKVIKVDKGQWDSVNRNITWNLTDLGRLERFKYGALTTMAEVKPTRQGFYTFIVNGNGTDSSGASVIYTKDLRYGVKGPATAISSE